MDHNNLNNELYHHNGASSSKNAPFSDTISPAEAEWYPRNDPSKTFVDLHHDLRELPQARVDLLENILEKLHKELLDWEEEEVIAYLSYIWAHEPACWPRVERAMYWHDGQPDALQQIPWSRDARQEYRRGLAVHLAQHPELAAGEAAPTRRPHVITLAEVQPKTVDWLWWPYIPLRRITLLDGDPGLGKSLMTCYLAAALSRGWPLPDQQGKPTLPTTPSHTLLLSAEDSLEDGIRPRLDRLALDPEHMGADVTKIHALTGFFEGDEETEKVFTLQQMDVLKAALETYHPRLVVIDPIQAYVGDIDINKSNQTRTLLAALAKVAEEYDCAIVCIRHLSKGGQGGKVIYRGMASIDFMAAARSGLYVEAHPTQPDTALMVHSKSNVGPRGCTHVFQTAEGHFRWAGVTRLTDKHLESSGRGPQPYVFLEALIWLEQTMRDGQPHLTTTIEQAAQEEGISRSTLYRVKKALGVQGTKSGDVWYWRLVAPPVLSPPSPLSPPLEICETPEIL